MGNVLQIDGYPALRVGADWASAVRGQTVYFTYQQNDIAITEATAPDTLAVATPLSARSRPVVDSVTLTVEEWVCRGGPAGPVTLTLAATGRSALFWSESAVEKFLFPYYASAGGPDAYAVIHAINRAWNHYRTDEPVVALAFGYATEPLMGLKQLWETVQVIYCGIGKDGAPALLHLPLLDFVHTLPPAPLTTIPAPMLGSSGAAASPVATPTPVDSWGAREVAEYVSGLRGNRVRVYAAPSDGGLSPTLTPVQTKGANLLFDAFTGYVRDGRPRPRVELDVEGCTKKLWRDGDPANDPDSVFWTDGAVEMLLAPYYASVEGHLSPWYLMLLLGKWAGLIPSDLVDAEKLLKQLAELAGKLLLETAEGVLGTLGRRLAGAEEPGLEGLVATDVYSVIHLPHSEWVDETAPGLESILLENRTWLLTRNGDHPLVGPRRRLLPRWVRG